MNSVVEDINSVVLAMRDVQDGPPYYMFGPNVEVAKELLQKDSSPSKKAKKYPLVILNMPFVEDSGKGLMELNLHIAIVNFTKVTYNAQERYDNVIKPILYPLYERFFEELRKSGIFVWKNFGHNPPHRKIDRPYWGTLYSQGNNANIFNDPLDAIEITDLKINKRLYRCDNE